MLDALKERRDIREAEHCKPGLAGQKVQSLSRGNVDSKQAKSVYETK